MPERPIQRLVDSSRATSVRRLNAVNITRDIVTKLQPVGQADCKFIIAACEGQLYAVFFFVLCNVAQCKISTIPLSARSIDLVAVYCLSVRLCPCL